MKCTKAFAWNNANIISSSFIRPEDLERYKSFWYTNFKLCDRENTTEWNIHSLDAYIKGIYDWNLSDIMSNWSNKWQNYEEPILLDENIFKIENINKLKSHLRFTPYIDNRKLDNFLEFFIKNKYIWCANEICEECNYCRIIWDKTIQKQEIKRKIISSNLDNAINSII